MKGWNEGITNAIAYIENNLTQDIDMASIASQAYVSSFYFQKIFHVLCGYTVSEYIRNRRMSLAAVDLSSSDAKVIDIALKYGYDSPDSFARAFSKFHGISPSMAKTPGQELRSFAPLKIKLTLEGGTMLEYKIVEKNQFTIMGVSKTFNTETSYTEIPKFWQEHMKSPASKLVCGMYGLCIGAETEEAKGNTFDYYIADDYKPFKDLDHSCQTKVIPSGTWAVFPCRGALPKALQEINTKIWSEWLPSTKSYALSGNYNIEYYTEPTENPQDNYCEIWIPVKKV